MAYDLGYSFGDLKAVRPYRVQMGILQFWGLRWDVNETHSRSSELWSKPLKGGYIGDYIGDYYRGY